MNDNTVLRIKVPAHLYESVKEQLTLKEAKSGKAFGDWKVVKEKKLPKEKKEKVEEDLRKGVFDNFEEWKKSFPEGTEFKQENNYMVAKDSEDKELGKWNPIQKQGMHADDFQYKSLEEAKPKKERSLDELKAVKEKLEKKIHEMENVSKKEPVEEAVVSPEILDAINQIVDFAKDNAGYLATVGGITGIAKMIADKLKQDPDAKKALDKATGAGSTDRSFFEEKKEEE